MKILLVDDHQLFLDGICHVIQRLADGVELVPLSDPLQACELLFADESFDLVMLDINMPRMNGLAFLTSLQQRNCTVPVIAVSATESIEDMVNVLEVGALGIIPKSHNADELLTALREVLDGNVYIPAELQTQVARLQAQRQNAAQDPLESGVNTVGVTRRQREVLKLVAQGYSNKEIGVIMHLTEHTVKSHLSALFQLLHAKSRSECVQNAYKIGLIKLQG